jgi:protein-disulfide isomerase
MKRGGPGFERTRYEGINCCNKDLPSLPDFEKRNEEIRHSLFRVLLRKTPRNAAKYKIRYSPVVIVDDRVVFNGMPSIPEMEKIFSGRKQKEQK